MRSPKRWAIAAAGGLAISALAWVVAAGPVLPGPRLPDEVRCLAGIEKVRVQVPPLIGLPKEMAVNRDVMRKWFVDRLTEALSGLRRPALS